MKKVLMLTGALLCVLGNPVAGHAQTSLHARYPSNVTCGVDETMFDRAEGGLPRFFTNCPTSYYFQQSPTRDSLTRMPYDASLTEKVDSAYAYTLGRLSVAYVKLACNPAGPSQGGQRPRTALDVTVAFSYDQGAEKIHRGSHIVTTCRLGDVAAIDNRFIHTGRHSGYYSSRAYSRGAVRWPIFVSQLENTLKALPNPQTSASLGHSFR